MFVKVPAGQTMPDIRGELIRPLFDAGIPGYFSLTTDIPPQFLEMEMPTEDYALFLCDKMVPRIDLRSREVQIPSVQQVLWAIGWGGTNFTKFLREKPVRFLHQPFRAYKCPWRGEEAWRQIIVSPKGIGFSVETVCVAAKDPGDIFFGYLR